MPKKVAAVLDEAAIERKITTLLGFAQKAGAITSGEEGALLMVKKNQAHLLILAEDAADNTKKRALAQAEQCRRKLNVVIWGKKETLGDATGKAPRAIMAIKDRNFADAIYKLLALRKD